MKIEERYKNGSVHFLTDIAYILSNFIYPKSPCCLSLTILLTNLINGLDVCSVLMVARLSAGNPFYYHYFFAPEF